MCSWSQLHVLFSAALMVGSGMVLTLSGERRPACVSLSQRRSSFHVPLTLTPSDSGRRLEKLSAQDPKVGRCVLMLRTHAHEDYCSHVCLCVCVCVCVCYHSSASVRRVCDKLNLPARSSLNNKGFQQVDFAKKLSFLSYSLFFTFARRRRPFLIIEVAMWQVQLTTITYKCGE